MSALLLKLLAMGIMFVDHLGVALYKSRLIPWIPYRVMRIVGRGAFPIFCFQIVEGAMHTKRKWLYLVRLLTLALISEPFFDLAIYGRWWNPESQNVFFTLALGLVVVFLMQACVKAKGTKRVLLIAGTVGALLAALVIAERLLKTDYGWGGVLQIAVMGLLVLPIREIPAVKERAFSERFIRGVVVTLAVTVLAAICGGSEWFAFYALIPIVLYNGERGYSGKALQYALYFFYPVHLLLLGLVFRLP